MKKIFGFSLIEILMVLGLVALLVVFAVPAYQVYTQQSQVMTIIKQSIPAQLAVNDFFSENGTLNICGTTDSVDYLTVSNNPLITNMYMTSGKIRVVASTSQFPGRTVEIFLIPTVVSTSEPLIWTCTVTDNTRVSTSASANSDIAPKICSDICPTGACTDFVGTGCT